MADIVFCTCCVLQKWKKRWKVNLQKLSHRNFINGEKTSKKTSINIKKKNPRTNLHSWSHYEHSPPRSIMKVCSGDFTSLAFMSYFMLHNSKGFNWSNRMKKNIIKKLMYQAYIEWKNIVEVIKISRQQCIPSGFLQAYKLLSTWVSLPTFSLPCRHSSSALLNISSGMHQCSTLHFDQKEVLEQPWVHWPACRKSIQHLSFNHSEILSCSDKTTIWKKFLILFINLASEWL